MEELKKILNNGVKSLFLLYYEADVTINVYIKN